MQPAPPPWILGGRLSSSATAWGWRLGQGPARAARLHARRPGVVDETQQASPTAVAGATRLVRESCRREPGTLLDGLLGAQREGLGSWELRRAAGASTRK